MAKFHARALKYTLLAMIFALPATFLPWFVAYSAMVVSPDDDIIPITLLESAGWRQFQMPAWVFRDSISNITTAYAHHIAPKGFGGWRYQLAVVACKDELRKIEKNNPRVASIIEDNGFVLLEMRGEAEKPKGFVLPTEGCIITTSSYDAIKGAIGRKGVVGKRKM